MISLWASALLFCISPPHSYLHGIMVGKGFPADREPVILSYTQSVQISPPPANSQSSTPPGLCGQAGATPVTVVICPEVEGNAGGYTWKNNS